MKKFTSLACALATAATMVAAAIPASAALSSSASLKIETSTSNTSGTMANGDYIYFDVYIADLEGLAAKKVVEDEETFEEVTTVTGINTFQAFYTFDNTKLAYNATNSSNVFGATPEVSAANGTYAIAWTTTTIDDYKVDISQPVVRLAFRLKAAGISDLSNFSVSITPNTVAGDNMFRVADYNSATGEVKTDYNVSTGKLADAIGTFKVEPAVATTYAVTLGEGATTDYTGDLTAVPENTEITVTAAEKSGYTATLKKDGVAVTSPYTFAVTANTEFTVDYAEIVPANPHKYTLDDKGTCMKDTVKGIYYSLSVKNVADKLAIKVSDKVFEATGIPEVTGDTVSKLTYVILGVPEAIYNAVPALGGVTSGETVFEAE